MAQMKNIYWPKKGEVGDLLEDIIAELSKSSLSVSEEELILRLGGHGS